MEVFSCWDANGGGIGCGFFANVGIKLLAGRLRDIPVAVAVLAALFVIKFALLVRRWGWPCCHATVVMTAERTPTLESPSRMSAEENANAPTDKSDITQLCGDLSTGPG
jgi:hypothetical protein